MNQIGRFRIINILGKGAQGIVYLGFDPVLERNVAIKALNPDKSVNSEETWSELLKEARIISKIEHSNIVSIHEVIHEDEMHYLVFEYVKGELLSKKMNQLGVASVHLALELMLPVIEGISYAHQNNIIHCDLKPSNIIINEQNHPKIMDFGIARILSGHSKQTNHIYGTPRYIPPEYINNRILTASNDSYALGLMLYELLSGTQVYKAKDVKSVIEKVLNEPLASIAKINKDVDSDLEAIIIKATHKKAINRFHNAIELYEALKEYLSLHSAEVQQDIKKQNATIEFLYQRMKRKRDFPILSDSLIKINRAINENDKSFKDLANVVIEDFALTNKVLKLVNSAYYRRSGGEVRTISRAVMLLGFDAIRSIALSMILVDHLKVKTQAVELQNQIVEAIYSGVFSKKLLVTIKKQDVLDTDQEEIFLNSIFHNLGKLLTLYYFYEETDEIAAYQEKHKVSDELASKEILGVTYSALGQAVAESWSFPNYIIDTMKPFDLKQSKFKLQETQKLNHSIVSLASELTHIINTCSEQDWRKEAIKHWRLYMRFLPLDEKDLMILADQAKEEFMVFNQVLDIELTTSLIGKHIGLAPTSDYNDPTLELPNNESYKALVGSSTLKLAEDSDSNNEPEICAMIELEKGIAEIKRLLQTDFELKDICQLSLEVIYRAFQFDHAFLCMANFKKKHLEARLGFGLKDADLEQIKIPFKSDADLFHVAMEKGIDIFIQDIYADNISKRIPGWFFQVFDSQTFILLPIRHKKRTVALLYGDKLKAGELTIEKEELKKLQRLKALVVKAISRFMT